MAWFNERKDIKEQMVILSAKRICVEAHPNMIDSYNGNEMVCISGRSNTDETLADLISQFTKQIPSDWRELLKYTKQDKKPWENGTTHYHYHQEWRTEQIDSSFFHKDEHQRDHDKGIFAVPNETQNGRCVRLGQFILANWLIESSTSLKLSTCYTTSIIWARLPCFA